MVLHSAVQFRNGKWQNMDRVRWKVSLKLERKIDGELDMTETLRQEFVGVAPDECYKLGGVRFSVKETVLAKPRAPVLKVLFYDEACEDDNERVALSMSADDQVVRAELDDGVKLTVSATLVDLPFLQQRTAIIAGVLLLVIGIASATAYSRKAKRGAKEE